MAPRWWVLMAAGLALASCAKPAPTPPPVTHPPPPKPFVTPPPPPVHPPVAAAWVFQHGAACRATATSRIMSLEVMASAREVVMTARTPVTRPLVPHAAMPIAFANGASSWEVGARVIGKHEASAVLTMSEDAAGRVLVLLEGGTVRVGRASDGLPRLLVPHGGAAGREWFECVRQRLLP